MRLQFYRECKLHLTNAIWIFIQGKEEKAGRGETLWKETVCRRYFMRKCTQYIYIIPHPHSSSTPSHLFITLHNSNTQELALLITSCWPINMFLWPFPFPISWYSYDQISFYHLRVQIYGWGAMCKHRNKFWPLLYYITVHQQSWFYTSGLSFCTSHIRQLAPISHRNPSARLCNCLFQSILPYFHSTDVFKYFCSALDT